MMEDSSVVKDIGITVLTRNKKDYVIKCIQSIFKSSIDNFDVCVVDNGSTDGTIKDIKTYFGDKVHIIANDKGLGASIGFNMGMRYFLEKGYKYLMTCDDDIVVDKYAIEELYNFMETYKDVGIVGSKIYKMDSPQHYQEFGSYISFNSFNVNVSYINATDENCCEEIIYCDYVPACSMMVRSEAAQKVGLMPEENFIYWDDMELGYKYNLAGYKVAAYAKSKIWHKMSGVKNQVDTFFRYHVMRNRIRFFMKYCDKNQINKFFDYISEEIYKIFYGCAFKKRYNMIQAMQYALNDAIYGVGGQGDTNRVLSLDKSVEKPMLFLKSVKSVIIQFNGDYNGLANIILRLLKEKAEIDITVSLCMSMCSIDDIIDNVTRFDMNNVKIINTYNSKGYDLNIKMCKHITLIKEYSQSVMYMDVFCNYIFTEEDYVYWSNFESSLEIFRMANKSIFIEKAEKLRLCQDVEK